MKKMNKLIRSFLSLPNNIVNYIALKLSAVEYGFKLKINGQVKIFSRGKIKIGNGVTINSSLKSNPIGGSPRTTLLVKKDGTINIGDNVGISNSAFVAFDSITIKNDVLIGAGCKIYDTDFHSIDYNDRILQGDSKIEVSAVLIKKGAFIGAHSIILKGVTIGENSIIGAGSVVTKNIPDGEIWAGNPAKYIKTLEFNR